MLAVHLDQEREIQVLAAAVEGLNLLIKGLRRRGVAECERCAYSPDVVRFHLGHWRELVTATEGAGSSGGSIIGSGSRDRMKMVAILADLESATDRALEPLIRWQSVARIYKRQSRFKRYVQLRAGALLNLHQPEPSGPLAEAVCIERIASSLGWRAHEVCKEL